MNKKPYHAPCLSRFGHIEEVTRAFGRALYTDTIYHADGTVRGFDASSNGDAVIVPCGEQPPPYECG